jgi:hypothetical protein
VNAKFLYTVKKYCKKTKGPAEVGYVHAANNTEVLCGPVLNVCWWILSNTPSLADVTCPKCRKVLPRVKHDFDPVNINGREW